MMRIQRITICPKEGKEWERTTLLRVFRAATAPWPILRASQEVREAIADFFGRARATEEHLSRYFDLFHLVKTIEEHGLNPVEKLGGRRADYSVEFSGKRGPKLRLEAHYGRYVCLEDGRAEVFFGETGSCVEAQHVLQALEEVEDITLSIENIGPAPLLSNRES